MQKKKKMQLKDSDQDCQRRFVLTCQHFADVQDVPSFALIRLFNLPDRDEKTQQNEPSPYEQTMNCVFKGLVMPE